MYIILILEKYDEELIKTKKIFKKEITNLDDNKNINIYFSFINQGINSLLDNDIISKNSSNDYYFILGYMIFYSYIKKTFYNLNIGSYLYNMEMCYNKCYNKHYSYLDLMKIGISFIHK